MKRKENLRKKKRTRNRDTEKKDKRERFGARYRERDKK